MDTEPLVENLITSGALLIRGLKTAGVQVVSAGWIRAENEDRWTLYLSLPMADKEGPLASYRAVQKVFRASDAIRLNTSDVVVIGEEHPITKSILSLDRGAVRYRPTLIGPVLATGLYVYPQEEKPMGDQSGPKKIIVSDAQIQATTAVHGGEPIIRSDPGTGSPIVKGSWSHS